MTSRLDDLDRTLAHGRPSTYTNHSCRCAHCRIAWADYSRERRAMKRADPSDAPTSQRPPDCGAGV